MPPAESSVFYDLPIVFRALYTALAGIVVGGIEVYMVAHRVGEEISRLLIVFVLLSLALLLYQELSKRYKDRYGLSDASGGGLPDQPKT